MINGNISADKKKHNEFRRFKVYFDNNPKTAVDAEKRVCLACRFTLGIDQLAPTQQPELGPISLRGLYLVRRQRLEKRQIAHRTSRALRYPPFSSTELRHRTPTTARSSTRLFHDAEDPAQWQQRVTLYTASFLQRLRSRSSGRSWKRHHPAILTDLPTLAGTTLLRQP